MKKHHSTIAKVWVVLLLFTHVQLIHMQQSFSSQNMTKLLLLLFVNLLFSFIFFLQSLQQDVETQKTMVRHLEKRVQQVELDAQEKVCRECSGRIFCFVLFVYFGFDFATR